jgi:cytochrome c oxidase accessory protein FixG
MEQHHSSAGGKMTHLPHRIHLQITPPQPPVVPLYETPPKSYPQATNGRHRRIKSVLGLLLLMATALLPWLRWDRGSDIPDQAILFSFTDMKFYLFGEALWAQEFYLLTGVLIFSSLALFLATTLYGRVWCGFTCPQTVWTDLFVWIEKKVEGDRNSRIKLDNQPWTLAKIAKKSVKHTLWLGVSGLTGLVFVTYFTDAVQATSDLIQGHASQTLYGFWAFFTGSTYLMAGWVREQMCLYMCPWPRIQGGMLDEQSFLVTYDSQRGDAGGRGKDGQGDCIDCHLCLHVCPTGIDIRNGSQMDCINCGLCADACDTVMEKLKRPKSLIGWFSVASTSPFLRPRTVAYGVLMIATLGIMGWAGFNRTVVDLSVLPNRSPSFVRLADGSIRNGYVVKVVNRQFSPTQGRLTVSGLKNATLWISEAPKQNGPILLGAAADDVATYTVFIRQPQEDTSSGRQEIRFNFVTDDNHRVEKKSAFIAGDSY